MPPFKDLTWQSFGRLVVEKRAPYDIHGGSAWVVRCECNTVFVVSGRSLTNNWRRTSKTRSCGCLRDEILRENIRKRYQENSTKRHDYPLEYNCWIYIRARCKKKRTYLSKRWRSFNQFLEDMGPKPHPKATLGLRDYQGSYVPTNCYWRYPRDAR